jgi:threonyl-tRNA synthetase
MAAAVKQLFPDSKFDIGPATADGFYYDFDMEHRLADEDLKKIEKAMRTISNKKLPFEKFSLPRNEAEDLLKNEGQSYKLERLADIPEDDEITFYRCGDFTDLCRGPHVENTGDVRVFKLLSVAGAYFKGKETNPMLQRVYGTAFQDKQALSEHMRLIEEAKKRDHRKLGKELELFSFSDHVGPGLTLWHPKGSLVRHLIETFWKEEHFKHGYDLLHTPHIGKSVLWETSGHLEFYKDAMYAPMDIDGQDYYVKPMNCPFHIEIYKNRGRSYRELPLRWAETGTVYRYEKSGVLHGLMRVRGFTQDDAHIICSEEQVADEIREALEFSLFMWKAFGFADVKAYLATRPEKAVGDQKNWDVAISALEKAVESLGLDLETDEGGGAFYGPKIDLKIKDAIGREWQTSTIQFDFNLPERFDMTFDGKDGQKHRPYMIHRALLGSLERFFGILVEHYAGAFPLWLAPEQLRVIPIAEPHAAYAAEVADTLKKRGFRVTLDDRSESLGARIRKARNERIPRMAVIGEKEVEAKTVALRIRGQEESPTLSIDDLIEHLQTTVDAKTP